VSGVAREFRPKAISDSNTYYLRIPDGELLMERRSSGTRAVIADALRSTRWLLALNSVDRVWHGPRESPNRSRTRLIEILSLV
jgi:hypothetical protein